MANNSLNQVVLTALQQVSGSGSSKTGVLPDLLPVATDNFSSAITEASRQINTLTSANQALIETVLVDRKDLPSAGAGETPIVGLAPAVGNAMFQATGIRQRSLPFSS